MKREPREGFRGLLFSTAVQPDCALAVTASGTVRVWDSATGASIGAPMQHERQRKAFPPRGWTKSRDSTFFSLLLA